MTSALVAISTLAIVGCDQQKADINAEKNATISAIDEEKTAVDVAAESATKRTDINATIDKANIEAEKVATQAQLDANKRKADAEAVAAKEGLDALRKL